MKLVLYNNGEYFRIYTKKYDCRRHKMFKEECWVVDYSGDRKEVYLFAMPYGYKISTTNMLKSSSARFLPKGWYVDVGKMNDALGRVLHYEGEEDIRSKYGF